MLKSTTRKPFIFILLLALILSPIISLTLDSLNSVKAEQNASKNEQYVKVLLKDGTTVILTGEAYVIRGIKNKISIRIDLKKSELTLNNKISSIEFVGFGSEIIFNRIYFGQSVKINMQEQTLIIKAN